MYKQLIYITISVGNSILQITTYVKIWILAMNLNHMKCKMIYWKKDIQHSFNLCAWGYLLVIGIIKRELHQNVILLHIRYKYKCHMFFIFTFSCFKSLCALAFIPRWLIRLHEVIHNIIFSICFPFQITSHMIDFLHPSFYIT